MGDGASIHTACYKYDVFISYRSNILPDKPVAECLQIVLETFPIPRRLQTAVVSPGRWRSRLKVFRDTTDLNASTDLNEALKEKLRQSRYLIVVCTPNIPKSSYCSEEIRYFRELHGDQRILLLLVQGAPDASFPVTLTSVQADKTSNPASNASKDPLAADVRADSTDEILRKLTGAGIPKTQQARFKLLAPLLNCKSPDDLIQRDKDRVRRHVNVYTSIFLLLGLLFAGVIYEQNRREQTRIVEGQRQKRIRNDAAEIIAAFESRKGNYPTLNDIVALRALGEKSDEVRISVINQLVGPNEKVANENAARIRHLIPYVVHAVVGLDEQMRDVVKTVLYKHGQFPSSYATVNTACAELGVALSVDEPEFNRMLKANYLSAMKQATSSELVSLSSALAGIRRNLPIELVVAVEQEIVAFTEVVVRTMKEKQKNGEDTVSYQFAISELAGALANLDMALPEEQAGKGVEILFAAIEVFAAEEYGTYSSYFDNLAEAFFSVVARLSPSDAKAISMRIVAAMQQTNNDHYLSSLCIALGRLGRKLPLEQAEAGAKQIVIAMEKQPNNSTLSDFAQALGSFGEMLPRQQAKAGIQIIDERLTSSPDSPYLAEALGALSQHLSLEQADVGAQRLLTALLQLTTLEERIEVEHDGALAERHKFVLSKVGPALAGVCRQLAPQQAERLAQQLLPMMKTKYPWKTRYLVRTLASFGESLPRHHAEAAILQIVAKMKATNNAPNFFSYFHDLKLLDDEVATQHFANGVQRMLAIAEEKQNTTSLVMFIVGQDGVAEELSSDQAVDLARQIVAAMETESGIIGDGSSFGHALAILSRRMRKGDVISMLKSAVCVGNIRSEILEELDQKAGGAIDGDIWKTVEWAKMKGGDVQITRPMVQ